MPIDCLLKALCFDPSLYQAQFRLYSLSSCHPADKKCAESIRQARSVSSACRGKKEKGKKKKYDPGNKVAFEWMIGSHLASTEHHPIYLKAARKPGVISSPASFCINPTSLADPVSVVFLSLSFPPYLQSGCSPPPGQGPRSFRPVSKGGAKINPRNSSEIIPSCETSHQLIITLTLVQFYSCFSLPIGSSQLLLSHSWGLIPYRCRDKPTQPKVLD
jgi:hypothetical protein